MLAIVDADPIVYRVGYAGQDTEYHVVWENGEDPELDIFQRGDDKTALANMKEWKEAHPDVKILSEEKIIVPERIDHVLSTVRAILRDIRYSLAERHDCDVQDVRLRVLLSGPGNFRESIATVAPYKGNRSQDEKPYWYQQIRNYLTEHHDAEVISGREADDECAILQVQTSGPSAICTIDKDLDQVEGWHYNYVTKTHYYTSPEEGLALFYKQVLSGDSTDNIPGCYKIGSVRASSIVDSFLLDNPGDWEGLWKEVLRVYCESIEKHGEKCPYFPQVSKRGVEGIATEMARLVWMQRYPGQLWTPPGKPDELLEMETDYE